MEASVWQSAAKGKAFGLLGILNLTPDSFFDGGRHNSMAAALRHAEKLLAGGADILDLGAESTRPGATPIDAQSEIERLLPVYKEVSRLCPISIDTRHAHTARVMLDNGAQIINDVSGCLCADMRAVLAEYRPGYVLTHCGGHFGGEWRSGGMTELKDFFARSLARLACCLPTENIVLDPGIGFGKNLDQNLEIMANISQLREFGLPILAGISMKRWLGELLGLDVAQRSCPTAVASAILWQKGVFWHRVHEPWHARAALEVALALSS